MPAEAPVAQSLLLSHIQPYVCHAGMIWFPSKYKYNMVHKKRTEREGDLVATFREKCRVNLSIPKNVLKNPVDKIAHTLTLSK